MPKIRPDRQESRERSNDCIDVAMSTKISVVLPLAKCSKGDDNKAVDKGKNPLSCHREGKLKISYYSSMITIRKLTEHWKMQGRTAFMNIDERYVQKNIYRAPRYIYINYTGW